MRGNRVQQAPDSPGSARIQFADISSISSTSEVTCVTVASSIHGGATQQQYLAAAKTERAKMHRMVVPALLLLLALTASPVPPANAAIARVALVIGNSAYRHAAELKNPRNDAADVSSALEKLGFNVITGLDLDKQGMDRAIRNFAAALPGADVGLLF